MHFDPLETTLVVAYFGGWKSPPEPAVPWYLPSPWGVNPANNVYLGNFPERWPTYGTVDEDNQEVIDTQLTLAEDAGVNVFAVNWYRDDYLSYAATRMAASTVAPSVKWCIQWSNHYPSMSGVSGNKPYLFEGMRRAALRMTDLRYWRKNGKPVLIMFSEVHLDDVIRNSLGQLLAYTPTLAERNALIADMRSIVSNVLAGDSTGGISGSTVVRSNNSGPYLVLMTRTAAWVGVKGIDAITRYNVRTGTFAGTTRLARTFAEMSQEAERDWVVGNTLAVARGVNNWPTLMAGFDARAWGGTTSDPLHDNCTPTTAEFSAHLSSAKEYASHSGDGTVFLYAWNEFGEGGWIQPTSAIGTTRLDAIKSIF